MTHFTQATLPTLSLSATLSLPLSPQPKPSTSPPSLPCPLPLPPPKSPPPSEQTILATSFSCERHLHHTLSRAYSSPPLSPSDAGPARRTTFPTTPQRHRTKDKAANIKEQAFGTAPAVRSLCEKQPRHPPLFGRPGKHQARRAKNILPWKRSVVTYSSSHGGNEEL